MTVLVRLFHRFADEHARVELPGLDLKAPGGGSFGTVTNVALRRSRYHVEGKAKDAEVAVICKSSRVELREDRDALAEDGSFALDLPLGSSTPQLVLKVAGERHEYTLPRITTLRRRLARLAVLPRFLLTVLRLVPAGIRWRLHDDLEARERIKHSLGLARHAASTDLDPEVFAEPEDKGPQRSHSPVTLIVPVFNAFDLLPEMLERLRRNTDLPWRLILVEDGSTDARVRPFLRNWAAEQNAGSPERVELIENASNLGFVQSVNLAFARAIEIGQDVVLVNSDCRVPPDWASRLLAPLREHRHIATVTPMSNDAELLSAPVAVRKTVLPPDAVDHMDDAARSAGIQPSLSLLPTGVGFCMAISIAHLKRVPAFDTAFGRGYGEEVDWCQKLRAKGGVHCSHPGVFVEHVGGASFGSVTKKRLVRDNNRLISKRYPEFGREVDAFLRDDPLLTGRLFHACSWIAAQSDDHVPIFLAHSLGGGVDCHVEGKIKERFAKGQGAIVLRVGGTQRWKLEAHTPVGVTMGATNDFALIEKLLTGVVRRRVIYSCGVGDPWAHELPRHLMSLRRRGTDLLEVEIHDFFPVAPSQTLLGSDDVYDGLPSPRSANPAFVFRARGGKRVPLASWQSSWGALLCTSNNVQVYSPSSLKLIAQAYPKCRDRLELRPHKLDHVPRAVPAPKPGARPVVGVLGHVRRHKGAALLRSLSAQLIKGGQARLVVIGTVEPSYRLARGSTVHGTYQPRDIDGLVQDYGITCWLSPSIWPETFSFATHEMLATGLPVFGFDLGAQGDALRAAENGHAVPFLPGGDENALLSRMEAEGVIGQPVTRRAARLLSGLVPQA